MSSVFYLFITQSFFNKIQLKIRFTADKSPENKLHQIKIKYKFMNKEIYIQENFINLKYKNI